MARAIWTGAISFGLVNVPVRLYSAVSRKTVRFHQLHDADQARIQQKRICPADGEEVPYENIVKGYEIAPDRYVVVTPEELSSLEAESTRTIDISEFVELSQIDPIFYDHPYHLAPGQGGAKSYRLLHDAMAETQRVAIGRFVMRSREHLAAIRPMNGALTMATMVYADEVVQPDSIEEMEAAGEVKPAKRELEMAHQLIDSLASEFDPSQYRDDYRERLLELIERKAEGEEITVQPPAEAPREVPDLMSALEESIKAVKERGGEGAKRKAPAKRKRAAAKKGSGSKGSGSKGSGSKGGRAKRSTKRKSPAKRG